MNTRIRWVSMVLFVLAGCGSSPADRAAQPVTDFTPRAGLTDITSAGILQLASEHAGSKTVLVNVWATWCAPCVAEMPHLVGLLEKYPDDLELILVSADFDEQRAAAAAFLREQGAPEGMYFKAEADQEFVDGMPGNWSGAIPAIWIFPGAGGDVIFWEGARTEDEIVSAVAHAIKSE